MKLKIYDIRPNNGVSVADVFGVIKKKLSLSDDEFEKCYRDCIKYISESPHYEFKVFFPENCIEELKKIATVFEWNKQ